MRKTLPGRNTLIPAENQGLFKKFEIYRCDGSDAPGGKHHGCEYFVLDVDHDPCAKAALRAYAAAVEATHPLLAADMRTRYALLPIKEAAGEIESLTAERDALATRVAELEPDAGRYRWLRDDMDGNAQEEFIRLMAGSVLSRDDFDAALDAAREVKHG